MQETFSYIAPYMGEVVVLTLKTPDTARINQYFSEQRKIIRSGDDTGEKVDTHRKAFFDELFVSAEISVGDAKTPFDKVGVMDTWKEHCILSAFEVLGRIKNF